MKVTRIEYYPKRGETFVNVEYETNGSMANFGKWFFGDEAKAITELNAIDKISSYILPQPILPTDKERIDLLVAENVALKARLAKIEAVPLVKTALEPVAIIK